MKKIILSAFALFLINTANAQWKDGESSTTNATSRGNKAEDRTDTFYIPAKEAKTGEMKHVIEKDKSKNRSQSADSTSVTTTKTKSSRKYKNSVDTTAVK